MTDVLVGRGAARPAGMPDDVPAVPDIPAIPGLRFRGMRRPDDYAAVAELANGAAEADGVPDRHSAEEYESWLEHDPNRDLERDVILAEVGGTMVALASGGWELDNDGGHNYQTWGAVHPQWQRKGIGQSLLRWVEARQRKVAAEHPASVDKRMESWAYDREVGRLALLERNGYTAIRYWFEMERPNLGDIPDAPLPDEYAFRPGGDADPREVWDVVVAAFKDHFGSMDDSEESYQAHLSDPNRDPALWVLVEHEGRIVGTSLNRISRLQNEALGVRHGRINAVAVLREHRRRGLGRSIVAEGLRTLRDAGMEGATLGVDAQNPHGALGIYERLGFAVAEQGRVYRKPLNT